MKSWVVLILWCIGLVVVLSWIWRKLNPSPVLPPVTKDGVVSVTIDDPGMEFAPETSLWNWDAYLGDF